MNFSIRGLFLFSTDGEILFSQRFSLVESKITDDTFPLKTDEDMESIFKEKVLKGIEHSANFYHMIGNKTYIVFFPNKNCHLSVIPLIQKESDVIPQEIAASFGFLSFINQFLKNSYDNISDKYHDIQQYINTVMPLGSPIIHDQYLPIQLSESEKQAFLLKGGYSTIGSSHVPSWKVFLEHTKTQFSLNIRETITGSIDTDKKYHDVYGELKANARLSFLPEIKITLSGYEKLTNFASHFSVKYFSNGQLVLTPPTGVTQLLLWSQDENDEHPVDGSYEAKAVDETTLNITLYIKKKGNISNVSAVLYFPNRGNIVDHKLSSESVKFSKKDVALMWQCQFENNEATLTGELNFSEKYTGNNRLKAYIDFKGKNTTFSGVSISNVEQDGKGTEFQCDHSYSSENKKYILWGPMI